MRTYKLNGLTCCNFQRSKLRAVQKTTMLTVRLAAKTHHQIKKTVSTSFSQDELTLTELTETNIHVHKHVNFLPTYQLLHNEKYKCLAYKNEYVFSLREHGRVNKGQNMGRELYDSNS